MPHGGRIDDYVESSGICATEILDCSANLNPLGPPSAALQAILNGLSGIQHYPDSQHRKVKQVLAQQFHLQPENIVCGNGATECLELLVRWLQPLRCVILDPAFGQYEAIAARLGRPVVSVSLFDGVQFTLPLEELDRILRKGDLLFFNNPHNPSGAAWPIAQWWPHMQTWLATGIFIIIDESFMDFLPEADAYSVMQQATQNKNLFVVRSATKMYTIPGLRFGFVVGDADTMTHFETLRDPWSVNHLAQVAACTAYQDDEFRDQTYFWLKSAHTWLRHTWMTRAEWMVFPTTVNYFLVRFSSAQQASNILQGLSQQGIFLRPCGSFAGLTDAYVRIALRLEEENERVWSTVLRLGGK